MHALSCKINIVWIRFLIPILVVLLSGCSSFNRDWRSYEGETSEGIAGLWTGTWLSEANGHHGGLRCILTTLSDSQIQARYRASYMHILRFEYSVPMRVEGSKGVYAFTGEADLGEMAGGLYTYAGSITGAIFKATYHSERDWGIFELERNSGASD